MAISLTLFYGSPNAHNGAAASLGSIARASQKLNACRIAVIGQLRINMRRVNYIKIEGGEIMPNLTVTAAAGHFISE